MKMKGSSKKHFIYILFSLIFLLSSCSFFTKTDEISVSGELIEPDFQKSSTNFSARSAYPDYSSINVIYKVFAISGDTTKEAVVSGTSYSVTVTKGNWVFKVEGYLSSDLSKKVFEYNSSTQNIQSNLSLNFEVIPVSEKEAPGNVLIPVEVEATSGIVKGTATWQNKDLTPVTKSQNFTFSSENSYKDNFTMLSGTETSVIPGEYSVDFVFYNASDLLLYAFTETIVVYSNVTTTKWLNVSVYNTTDKISIKTETQIFDSICVDSVNGLDTNRGDFFAPLKTIDAAMSLISAFNLTEATINLKAGSSWTLTSGLVIPETLASLKIRGYGADFSSVVADDGIRPKIIQDDSLVDASLIKTTATKLELTNLVLQGSGVETLVNGVGIYAKEEVTITGCFIKGFSSGTDINKNKSGGAIYFGKSDSNLTLNNVHITGNTAPNGGGVFVEYGTLVCNGIQISDNAAYNGGGIYIDSLASLTTVEASPVNFVQINTAKEQGAGIYIYTDRSKAPVLIENFIITGNKITASSGGDGGGIYIREHNDSYYHVFDCSITSSIISGNTANKGSGIFASHVNLTLGSEDGNKPVVIGTTDDYTTANSSQGIYISYSGAVYAYSDVTIGNYSVSNTARVGNDSYGAYTFRDSSKLYLRGATIKENKSYAIYSIYGSIYFSGPLNISAEEGTYISCSNSSTYFYIENELAGEKIGIELPEVSLYEGFKLFRLPSSANPDLLNGIDSYFFIKDKFYKLSWEITDEGKLHLENSTQTTFYVSSSGDDNLNLGQDADHPLKSFHLAANYIRVLNDGVSEYSIILLSDLETSSTYSNSNSYANLTFTKPAKVTIKSDVAGTVRTLDIKRTKNDRRILLVNASAATGNVEVNINDIQLKGGESYNINSAGAVLCVRGNSTYSCVVNFNGNSIIGEKVSESGSVPTKPTASNVSTSNGFGIIYIDDYGTVNLNDNTCVANNYSDNQLFRLYKNSVLNQNENCKVYTNSMASGLALFNSSNGVYNLHGQIINNTYAVQDLSTTYVSEFNVFSTAKIYNNLVKKNGSVGFVYSSSNPKTTLTIDGAQIYDNNKDSSGALIGYDIETVASDITLGGSTFRISTENGIHLSSTTKKQTITISSALDYTEYNSSNPIKVRMSNYGEENIFLKATADYTLTKNDCDAFVVVDSDDVIHKVHLDEENGTGVFVNQETEGVGSIGGQIYKELTGSLTSSIVNQNLETTIEYTVLDGTTDISDKLENLSFSFWSHGKDVTATYSQYFEIFPDIRSVSIKAGIPAGTPVSLKVTFDYANTYGYEDEFVLTVVSE